MGVFSDLRRAYQRGRAQREPSQDVQIDEKSAVRLGPSVTLFFPIPDTPSFADAFDLKM